MNLSTLSPDSTEAAIAAYVVRMTGNGNYGKAVTMPLEYAIAVWLQRQVIQCPRQGSNLVFNLRTVAC